MNIEFQILKCKASPSKFERCLNSFRLNNVPYKIIHNEGNTVTKGRSLGYQHSDKDFISYVDDDDEILFTNESFASFPKTDLPIFTNSLLDTGRQTFCLNRQGRTWTLDNEINANIVVHQLMIFDKSLIKFVSERTQSFIKEHDLDENLFDYFIKTYVSLNIGWTYVDRIMYKWNTVDSFGPGSTTKDVPEKFRLVNLANSSIFN